MRNPLSLIGVLLLFFSFLGTQAKDITYEEGYIVSLNGDTTQGYIRVDNIFKNQQKIKFIDTYGVQLVYSSERIAAFGYLDQHFEKQEVPYLYTGLFSNPHMFMQRIVDGPARLYRFYTRRSVFTLQQGPAYIDLVQTPDGKFHEVSNNFRWNSIAFVFAEYFELHKAIMMNEYKVGETEKVVRAYNEWFLEEQFTTRSGR